MHTARTTRLIPLVSLVSLLALGAVACADDRSDPTADGRTSVVDSTVPSAAPVNSTTLAAPTTTTTVAAPVRPTGTVDTLLPIGEGGPDSTSSAPAPVQRRSCSSPASATAATHGGAVAPELSADSRVCSYDRFGTGTSDAPPADQTFTSEADDLHQLLQTAGEVGPYVVVQQISALLR